MAQYPQIDPYPGYMMKYGNGEMVKSLLISLMYNTYYYQIQDNKKKTIHCTPSIFNSLTILQTDTHQLLCMLQQQCKCFTESLPSNLICAWTEMDYLLRSASESCHS